jgi:hypothetical protein
VAVVLNIWLLLVVVLAEVSLEAAAAQEDTDAPLLGSLQAEVPSRSQHYRYRRNPMSLLSVLEALILQEKILPFTPLFQREVAGQAALMLLIDLAGPAAVASSFH